MEKNIFPRAISTNKPKKKILQSVLYPKNDKQTRATNELQQNL